MWIKALCSQSVFNRQGVKPLTQHHVFAVQSHIDCWCSDYPVTHSSVRAWCTCVCWRDGLSVRAQCGSSLHQLGGWRSTRRASCVQLADWNLCRPHGSLLSLGTLVSPLHPPSRPDISLLCCRPLSDASIKQESAAGICTHLNRLNGLEEVWLRYMPFHPRLYFPLWVVTKNMNFVFWGENKIKIFFSANMISTHTHRPSLAWPSTQNELYVVCDTCSLSTDVEQLLDVMCSIKSFRTLKRSASLFHQTINLWCSQP